MMEGAPPVDYQQYIFYLHAVELLGIVVLGIMQFAMNRHRATKESINRVEQACDERVDAVEELVRAEAKAADARMDEHAIRLTRLEQQMPSDDKWKGLYERLSSMERSIESVKSGQKATDRLVHGINDFLRNHGT